MKQITKNKQKLSQKKPEQARQLTFVEHIYELRARLFWVIATLLVASAAAFQYKDSLVSFVMQPLQGQKLIYLTPGGGFSFIFTLCLYFGALLTIPVVVYHLYRFLQPVMGRTPRRLLGSLIGLSILLALSGAAFGYYVAIPAAIQFLTGFAGDAVSASLTAESYLGFVMTYMFGLAVLFQLPLVIFMVDHIRRFPPGTLLSSQRFVVVGAVIAAAIITPTPDVINQMIIAVPIVAIYQLGVLAVYIRRRREGAEQPVIKVPIAPKGMPAAQPKAAPVQVASNPRPLATPVAVAVQPAVPIKQPPALRSIDGFRRPKTRAATSLPVRPAAPRARPVAPLAVRSARPLRSLDGFQLRKLSP